MAKRKKKEKQDDSRERRGPLKIEPVEKPLRVARVLSGAVLCIGGLMLVLGGGVAFGMITEGWGFPMSAVSNWGKSWGVVLMVGGAAYVVGPVSLFRNPDRGSIVLMIVCGLGVLVGTPLITTTTEIFYNLFQETKSRPDWVDSVWGYYMILNIAVIVALYKAYPVPEEAFESEQAG